MSVTDWLRAQGNEGAVANAKVLLEQRRREEWVVRALVTRLDAAATGALTAEAA